MADCRAAASGWLRRRNEPHVDTEGACQRAERCGRRVGLASFYAADLGLVDACAIGELPLREVERATLRGELTREREVQAKTGTRIRRRCRVRSVGTALTRSLVSRAAREPGGRTSRSLTVAAAHERCARVKLWTVLRRTRCRSCGLGLAVGGVGAALAAEPSTKAKAWALFDRIVADAAPSGVHTNPWVADGSGPPIYSPDIETLARLLAVPLHLRAATTTGAPALAFDVWISYELRRAGFDRDAVWPRPARPRVLPTPIVSLLNKVTKSEREALLRRLQGASPPSGAAATDANILGKNYVKQVDVVMSAWDTGPELLVSTKRMDSSFGKNAANRVEESYGDAKNLRLRHPLAALGFVYGLRSTIFDQEPRKAEWLIDLLEKLGREDDAYHAVALIVIEYADHLTVSVGDDDPGDGEDPLAAAGLTDDAASADEEPEDIDQSEVDQALAGLPAVDLPLERVPSDLQPAHFMGRMVRRVLDATPVNRHGEARKRMRQPAAGQ